MYIIHILTNLFFKVWVLNISKVKRPEQRILKMNACQGINLTITGPIKAA